MMFDILAMVWVRFEIEGSFAVFRDGCLTIPFKLTAPCHYWEPVYSLPAAGDDLPTAAADEARA